MTATDWADLANILFIGCIIFYALAMFGFALEYAFDTREAKPEKQKELAAVGGGSSSDAATPPDDHQPVNAAVPITPATARLAGRLSLIFAYAGTILLWVSIVMRTWASGRWPWGNMFEFTIGMAAVGMVTWLVLVARKQVPRRHSLFATFAVTITLGLSVRVYTEAGPIEPALDSYWIVIHVTAAVVASGIFLVGFVFAVMHLMKRRYDRLISEGKTPSFLIKLARDMANTERLERLTFKMHVLAFPLWTFSILAGSLWAHLAWGRYWAWDPKEVWAFAAWVVYAAYLHARVSGKSARMWAPWLAIIGWAVVLFNLFAVNLIFPGLHSYAGV